MSLQKTSVPALEIDDGAVIAALLLVVVAAFLLLPPHPAARRTSRRTRAPTGAVSLERDTAELLSLISLAKIRLSDLLVAEKRRGLVREGDLAGLQHVPPAGDVEGHHRVLLHEQNRRPLCVDLLQGLEYTFHEDRCKPHGRFVEQQQLRPGHQRPPDRAHLLLAARQRPRLLALPFREPREEREDTVQVLSDLRPIRALKGAHLEVLDHRHAREELAALGRLRDPAPHDLVRRRPRDVLVFEEDRASARTVETVDRAERRGLARAVRADQRDDLACTDLQRDPLQRFDRAVERVDVLDVEDAVASHSQALPSRDTPRSRADPSGPCSAALRRSSRRSRVPSPGPRPPSQPACRAR